MARKKQSAIPVRLYFYRDCVTGGVAYEAGKPADVPAYLAQRLKAAGAAGETPEPPEAESEEGKPAKKEPAKKSTKKDADKE